MQLYTARLAKSRNISCSKNWHTQFMCHVPRHVNVLSALCSCWHILTRMQCRIILSQTAFQKIVVTVNVRIEITSGRFPVLQNKKKKVQAIRGFGALQVKIYMHLSNVCECHCNFRPLRMNLIFFSDWNDYPTNNFLNSRNKNWVHMF